MLYQLSTLYCCYEYKNSKAFKYFLDNCIYKFGTRIYQQILNFPVRCDPAPFMANLFLYYCDDKWISTKKEKVLYHP